MHIVDMYASRDLNQVSLSLLGTTPNSLKNSFQKKKQFQESGPCNNRPKTFKIQNKSEKTYAKLTDGIDIS
jgi:hypothetical protein